MYELIYYSLVLREKVSKKRINQTNFCFSKNEYKEKIWMLFDLQKFTKNIAKE